MEHTKLLLWFIFHVREHENHTKVGGGVMLTGGGLYLQNRIVEAEYHDNPYPQSFSDPRFSFLNSFRLNLEERHLACGFKCTPRN